MIPLRTKQALEVVSTNYKKKGFHELNRINGSICFSFYHDGKNYDVEVETDKNLDGILRVMVLVEPKRKIFRLLSRGHAIYFGVTRDGNIVKNDDMVF